MSPVKSGLVFLAILVISATMQPAIALTWSADSDWATGNFSNTTSINGILYVNRSFYREFEPITPVAAAWWHFNDGSGSASAADSSGNGNGGQLGNSSAWTSPTWVAGRFGTSGLNFSGVQFVNVSNSSSLNITRAITIEAWVNLNSTQKSFSGSDNYASVVSKDGSFYMRAYTNASGLQRAGFWIYINGARIGASVADDLRGTGWHLLAGTYDGAVVKFYIDGAPKATTAASGLIDATNNNIYIGGYNGTSEFFNGTIDEVRITNTTLVDNDIDFDYAGFFRSASYLSNNTQFGTPVTSVVANFSKNEYNYYPGGALNLTNLTLEISVNNGTTWRQVQNGVNVSTLADNGTSLMFRANFSTNDTRLTATLSAITLTPAFRQNIPPNVTLVSPQNGYSRTDNTDVSVTFNCSAMDDEKLFSISLWHNMTGTWHQTATAYVNGTYNRTSFNVNGTFGNFTWNCMATDSTGRSAFAPNNFTFSLASTSPPVVALPSLGILFSPSPLITVEQGQNGTVIAMVVNAASNNALASNVTLSFTESACCTFFYSPYLVDVPAPGSQNFTVIASALESASVTQFSIVVTAHAAEGAVASAPLTVTVTPKTAPTPSPTSTTPLTPTPTPTPDPEVLAAAAIANANSTISLVDIAIAVAERERKNVQSAVSKLAAARGLLRKAYSLMSGETIDYQGAQKAANDATALANEALSAIPAEGKSPFADLWILVSIVGLVSAICFITYTTFFMPKGNKPPIPATYRPPQQQVYQYYKNYPYYYPRPAAPSGPPPVAGQRRP